jgi:putative hemolysin
MTMLRIKTLSRRLTLGLLASTFLLAGAQSANAQPSPAAAYCTQNGGVVQTRYPAFGTNNSNPLRLAGTAQFCQLTSATDGSRINVLLETLYTQQPSLAAFAYLFKPPFSGNSHGANPSSVYCQEIGGTTRFGAVSAAGGGWVLENNPQDVVSFCVFSDLSMIDAWGLLYHTNNIIRGKDLTTVLRYKPNTSHNETYLFSTFP